MVRQTFKISLAAIAFCSLSIIFSIGWYTSWSNVTGPKSFKRLVDKIPSSSRRLFEEQASFDTIRSYFGASSQKNFTVLSPISQDEEAANISVIHDIVQVLQTSPEDTAGGERNDSFNQSKEEEFKGEAGTPPEEEEERTCGQPKNNILFFKMHKCSSSTIQNILMRYGDHHDLNFVLPPRGNYLGHDFFNTRTMLKFPVKEYNIFCHHTRFNFKGMSSVMPKDTIWTTIIRDPVDMFESTFYYRSLGSNFKIKTKDPLATFSGNPSYYTNKYGHLTLARDPMMFDLGLTNEQKGNVKAIEKLISHLDDSFDLVLITEYFEESLILLRDLMCWQTDDIVSFVVNARAKSSVHEIRKDVRRRLWEWNSGDAMLYDHFNKTFWRKVEAYGVEKMRKEVVLLKARNRELNDKCILDPDKTVNQGGIWHPQGIDIKGLVLKEDAKKDKLCSGMARAELTFTSYLLQKQKKKYGMR
ncbi:galactosylceramide sulfotransferase-like isoform X2 [Apostichopus japonicus]|uniref:galactosylceramide sulfotransferase-like isoform X2 n=1 Tax=Stichopus japonicus TaxID=307972 RepID=UPI003AB72DEF